MIDRTGASGELQHALAALERALSSSLGTIAGGNFIFLKALIFDRISVD
jgi:hypothetical protein